MSDILDRLRAAAEEHRKECDKQPPHDICFDCEVSELFAEAAGTIASLNDKLVMQDIQLQALRDRAESDKHLALTLSKQLDEAENEREKAHAGWEATKAAAQVVNERLKTETAELLARAMWSEANLLKYGDHVRTCLSGPTCYCGWEKLKAKLESSDVGSKP